MPKVLGDPTPRFNLANASNKEATVTMLFRYDGKILRYSPGVKVNPKHWDKATQRPKQITKPIRNGNGYEDIYLEARLLLDKVAKATTEIFKETKGKLSVEAFKVEIQRRTGYLPTEASEAVHIPTLPEFAAEYVAQRGESLGGNKGTWKVLNTVANYLMEYSKEVGQRLTFEEIDYNFKHNFTNWMYQPPRQFSVNYASKVATVIRQFMKEAKRRKLHNSDDYKDISLPSIKNEQFVLSQSDVDTLYSLDLSTNARLERIRDLFLIGYYTGLRFSDFSRIEPEHIIDVDGIKMLELGQKKTKGWVTAPLIPELTMLLEKYDYNPPKPCNQEMNRCLKEIGQLAGFTQKIKVVESKGGVYKEVEKIKWTQLSTHVARRSFATNISLLGVPTIHVMKQTGHATEKQFMGYVHVGRHQNAKLMFEHVAKLGSMERLKEENEKK